MSDDIRAGISGTAALKCAIRRLRANGVDTPQRDARILLAWALNISTDRVALALPDGLDARSAKRYQSAVANRAQRMPVSLILGKREFYGREFVVTADVLDPRPETETLVEAALSAPFSRLLDLGTGTGCILLSLLAERPEATGVGADVSPLACAVADENTRNLDLSNRARIVQSDWYARIKGTFDLIVTNPPYVTTAQMQELAPEVRHWDPELALAAGGDGLAPVRSITAEVMQYLTIGGRLIAEIGPFQAPEVVGLFTRAGLKNVNVATDLDGRERIVIGHRVAPKLG